MAKVYRFMLYIHLFTWGILTGLDYISLNKKDDFLMIPVVAIPVLVCILYLLFQKKIYAKRKRRGVTLWSMIGVWVLLSVILGVLFTLLTCKWNVWIVPQVIGGLAFDGLEYPIMDMAMLLPVIPILLGEGIRGLIKRFAKNVDVTK